MITVLHIGCTKEIAITVVATILIECLLAALIIAAGLALHWKRSQRYQSTAAISFYYSWYYYDVIYYIRPQSCDKRDAMQDGEINLREGVYEEPDIHMTAYYNTNVLGNFMLTECPAYVATT